MMKTLPVDRVRVTAMRLLSAAIAGSFALIVPVGGTVAATPEVTATPSDGLHEGQRIMLALTGFPPNSKMSITECTSRRQVRPGAGCPDGTQGAVAAVAGGNGAVWVAYVVHERVSGIRCRSQCLIEASFGDTVATTPVSFATATLPFTGWRGQELMPLLGLTLLAAGCVLVLAGRQPPQAHPPV